MKDVRVDAMQNEKETRREAADAACALQYVGSVQQATNHSEMSVLSDPPSDILMRSAAPAKAREEGMYVPVFPHDADVAQGPISMPAAGGIVTIGYRINDVILWSIPSGNKV